jgi:hypothetical protein
MPPSRPGGTAKLEILSTYPNQIRFKLSNSSLDSPPLRRSETAGELARRLLPEFLCSR